MKTYKKIIFFLGIGISLSFCASKEAIQTDFPQEISFVYFQKWVGGRVEAGGGTNFHIEFTKPLSSGIQLEKVYFENQEAKIERENDTHYMAHFINKYEKPPLEDDNQNGQPQVPAKKSKFDLKPNQAMLEYKKNNKTLFYKISDIQEKPMIAYPSIKPKN